MPKLKAMNVMAATALAAGGCAAPDRSPTLEQSGVSLYEGMGRHHRAVATTSPLAQRYFDQGLVLAFAFNHDEAIRAFREAARLDPGCAMAWWGVALCNGPHINNPVMPPERSREAWEALRQARSRRQRASPLERELIDALGERYADPPPADRRPLDEAYARAMRSVHEAHPGDADVAVLFAEALMDLRPWDLWTLDGVARPETPEILAALEAAMRADPDHPGALHLYIHAQEASPHPEQADAVADRLRSLVPAAGHLVHMPSHIDVQVGRWALAVEQNQEAIEADRAYRAIAPRQGFYHIYMAHNHHMLTFAAMMQGRSDLALRTAREQVAGVPEDYARREAALIDGFMIVPYDVLKRFGRWDDLLREPAPPEYLPITTAMWRFSRALALAAKGRIDEAEREQAAFREAVARVPPGAVMSLNPAEHVLRIADRVLAGELALARGELDASVEALREAVALEDTLRYMEPPEWIQPVRHTLGAVLVRAGRHQEAEQVYREDLADWPGNGWSLYGLAGCLRARGEAAEAEEVERRFREVWSRADVQIGSSCFCVPGARASGL